MLQVVNISQARNNLAKVIKGVKETRNPVVIVQDSIPVVVIQPYEGKSTTEKSYLERLLDIKGDWISQKEFQQTRLEVEKRLLTSKSQ